MQFIGDVDLIFARGIFDKGRRRIYGRMLKNLKYPTNKQLLFFTHRAQQHCSQWLGAPSGNDLNVVHSQMFTNDRTEDSTNLFAATERWLWRSLFVAYGLTKSNDTCFPIIASNNFHTLGLCAKNSLFAQNISQINHVEVKNDKKWWLYTKLHTSIICTRNGSKSVNQS